MSKLNTSKIETVNASDSLVLNTGSAERLRITSTGRVGIGTSSPTSGFALDVNGYVKNTNTAFYVGVADNTVFVDTTGNKEYRRFPWNNNFLASSSFDTGTGVFTAPVAGKYFFTVEILFKVDDTAPYAYFVFGKNGGMVSAGGVYGTTFFSPNTGGTNYINCATLSGSAIFNLVPGDQIDVRYVGVPLLQPTLPNPHPFPSSGRGYNGFCGYLMG